MALPYHVMIFFPSVVVISMKEIVIVRHTDRIRISLVSTVSVAQRWVSFSSFVLLFSVDCVLWKYYMKLSLLMK